MPRMDGLTLCRILKATDETRFTHVIMLSARGETEAKVTGLETGADDYLVKPIEPVELKARVRVGLRLQRALLDLAAKNEILEKLALTDPLTGLANRRAFQEALDAEVARVARHGASGEPPLPRPRPLQASQRRARARRGGRGPRGLLARS